MSEFVWRVSPEVFHDLHTIIAKHGIGLPDLDEDMRQALFGDRRIGPDAAALEIREKYDLSHLPIGTQLRVVVDFQMIGYGKPEYKV